MNERERLVRSAQRGIDVARELAREGFLISAIVNLSDAVELALGCAPDDQPEPAESAEVACDYCGRMVRLPPGVDHRCTHAKPPEQPAPIVRWVVIDTMTDRIIADRHERADLGCNVDGPNRITVKLIEEKPFKRDLAKRLRAIAGRLGYYAADEYGQVDEVPARAESELQSIARELESDS